MLTIKVLKRHHQQIVRLNRLGQVVIGTELEPRDHGVEESGAVDDEQINAGTSGNRGFDLRARRGDHADERRGVLRDARVVDK